MRAPPAALDPRAVRAHFARAAPDYDKHDVAAREIARRLFERLQYLKIAPRRVLDVGCGTGADLRRLGELFPRAECLAGCDASYPMLAAGRSALPWHKRWLPLRARGAQQVCGDAQALPFAAGAFDLAWSNLMLHWMGEPLAVFREVHRVLSVGGAFLFSTLGPDSLRELRGAMAAAGGAHVHDFIDMHDLGDMLVAAGFEAPVMDVDYLTLTYSDLVAVRQDIRHNGACNALQARARGLMGRQRGARVYAAIEAARRQGRLPLSLEVVYGHAWKPEPRVSADGRAIIRVQRAQR
ncbi:MAG: methyltransferase domain-containing protein [Rhodocyclaceae bacterium]|nr:methyltransferase domain-containing protein [Rhodocyclaceae bacterium]MBX3668163.1 methyltransferase domain-containing protein [Rhodocyclaceae bacterium]